MLGKAPGKMPTQLARLRTLPARRNHIAHKPLAPARIRPRNHRRLRNAAMANQRSLDLPRLNAEPAHLHLRVRATQKLQNPVTTPARKVPGAVHPAPRNPIRVGHKPLPRQPSSPKIATRKPSSRYVKLPAHPRRNRLQSAVQDVNPRVPDRTSNRHCAVI